MKGALSGIKIIDLSRLLPGPYCSMILADHGAEVVAIEDKQFKSDNLFFNTINRNKKHISLNLKTAKGKDIFFHLVKDSDVVIEGFRPGVCKKLGIDYNTVQDVNPQIIYCSISGYGQTGPCKNWPGHDVNYLSKSGVLNFIGEPNRPPIIPGVQIADILGGSMNAVIGILLALYARKLSGIGQHIDISMTDGLLSLLVLPLHFKKNGQHYERGDSFLSHRYACYNTYETSDRRFLSIGAVEKRFWQNLCNYLGKPEYASLQYDDDHRLEILRYMRNKFNQKTLSEWDDELSNAEVCLTACLTMEEILTDPLFKEREMVISLNGKNGNTIPMIGVPVKLSKTPGSIRTPPVNFGESTESLLAEMGYSTEDIDSCYKKGII